MNQSLSIYNIRQKLHDIMENTDSNTAQALSEVDASLGDFLDYGIDFKRVVDGLDDSLLITDNTGKCIYVNPAYSKNTSIQPKEILGKVVMDEYGPGKLFSHGAVGDVIKTGKVTFCLCKTSKNDIPLTGYIIGTPLFDNQGNLQQVIALSRPIVQLKGLRNDFAAFVSELNQIQKQLSPTTTDAKEQLSPPMIGKETTMAPIWSLIHHIAPTDATVLITGESGTGKEVLADEIFRNSNRKNERFVKLNCASIPAQLFESELFGYEKGAFSGANAKGKPGLFELANHGTLLLDEIGDMPLDLQVKLLRAIQTKEITRIGGIKPIHLDVRIIAATNCNLKAKVADGTFRQDLFYRLNVVSCFKIPPLRERKDDIEALCDFFIRKFSEKYHSSFSLTELQLDYLRSYNWPGNIRELENIMEYLVICSSGVGAVNNEMITNLLGISNEIVENPMSASATETAASLAEISSPSANLSVAEPQPPVAELQTSGNSDTAQNTPTANIDFTTAVEQYEKKLIEEALQHSKNLREAGKLLNVNASTVSRKIKQYHINYPSKK